jgi:hypothetical protein
MVTNVTGEGGGFLTQTPPKTGIGIRSAFFWDIMQRIMINAWEKEKKF